MPSDYYSDRVRGQRARQNQELTEVAWGGIVALYHRYIATNWLAEDFPKNCEDGYGPYACDEQMVGLALAAEIPEVGLSLRPGSMPSTLAALDLLEFLYVHASEPVQGSHHKFFGHYHLSFDSGKAQVRHDSNTLLARNGMAFELSAVGRIEALASEALEEQLRHGLPPSVDPEFDQLVNDAIRCFRSSDPAAHVKAVEPLWDAFERMKTILDPDKKRGVAELLDAVSGEAAERGLLEKEMQALTRIGNEFRIRHHEVSAVKVDTEQAEWLFARLYALIVRLHPAIA
jgi:hypothetical protein